MATSHDADSSVSQSLAVAMPAADKERKSAKWVFTWNNPPSAVGDILKDAFSELGAEKYAFQLERGTTLHIQGAVVFKSRKALRTLKIPLPTPHWEVMRGTVDQSFAYCVKDDETTVTGAEQLRVTCRWLPPQKLKTGMEGHVWHSWQEDVRDLVRKEPDERKIHWFHDVRGCTGKTSMAKWLIDNEGACYASGEGRDVLSAISDWILPDKGEPKEFRVFVYDVPRLAVVDYTLLERIKNGIAFSGKYRSKFLRFNTPHVVVFSNEPPNEGALSADRWDIHEVSPAKRVRVEESSDGVEAVPSEPTMTDLGDLVDGAIAALNHTV